MASDSGNNLRIDKLNGANYRNWKFNMQCLLMERGLWGYVTGSSVKPELKTEGSDVSAQDAAKSKEKLDEYNLKADKAYSLIALSVNKDLQIMVQTSSSAKEAWDNLKNQFDFVSAGQLVRLSRRFFGARMEEGGDLMKHITEMTSMAEQLREMEEDVSSKKFAVTMLGSLPDSYENFVTSMNTRDASQIEWTNVQGALMEEYEKRKDKDKQQINNEALFSSGSDVNWRNRGIGSSNRGRGGFSNNRGRGGFGSSRGGYHNHGGASRGSNRGQQGRSTPYRFTGTCFHCQNVGHRVSECPEMRRNDGEEASVAETNIFHEDDVALLAETYDDSFNDIEIEESNDMELVDNNSVVAETNIFHEDDVALFDIESEDSSLVAEKSSFHEDDVALLAEESYDLSNNEEIKDSTSSFLTQQEQVNAEKDTQDFDNTSSVLVAEQQQVSDEACITNSENSEIAMISSDDDGTNSGDVSPEWIQRISHTHRIF